MEAPAILPLVQLQLEAPKSENITCTSSSDFYQKLKELGLDKYHLKEPALDEHSDPEWNLYSQHYCGAFVL